MTFCNAKCANFDCPRKFTDTVVEDARRWWKGDGAPIALSDFSDNCTTYQPEVK
jgi:hypothetical protein